MISFSAALRLPGGTLPFHGQQAWGHQRRNGPPCLPTCTLHSPRWGWNHPHAPLRPHRTAEWGMNDIKMWRVGMVSDIPQQWGPGQRETPPFSRPSPARVRQYYIWYVLRVCVVQWENKQCMYFTWWLTQGVSVGGPVHPGHSTSEQLLALWKWHQRSGRSSSVHTEFLSLISRPWKRLGIVS